MGGNTRSTTGRRRTCVELAACLPIISHPSVLDGIMATCSAGRRRMSRRAATLADTIHQRPPTTTQQVDARRPARAGIVCETLSGTWNTIAIVGVIVRPSSVGHRGEA